MKKWFLLSMLAAVTGVYGQTAQTGSRYGKAEMTHEKDGMVTEIAFYTPEIVNVRHYKTESEVAKNNLVVTLAKQDCAVSVGSTAADTITLTGSALTVKYSRSTGCVAFFSPDGGQLLKEKDGATTLTARKDGTSDSYTVKQTFKLQSGERTYGLGQLQNGNWNQRNKSYDYMIQGNTSVWIPYLQSTKGYALYWDNASPTSYKDNSQGMSFESAAGYGVDYFFLLGSTTDGQVAVQRMRQLTGQMPMIPLWAYGFLQSKERYESASQTMGVMKRYRDLRIPIDCVVQDWQYWGGNNQWNAMEFLSGKFRNYQQMIDSVHHMNGHILISTWANFGRDTKPFAWFKEHNMLFKCGDTIMTDTYPSNEGVAVYDAYNPEARDKYWEYLYNGIASKGIDAYWLDSSEPDHYQGGSDMEKTFDFVTGLGCTWRAVRNAYPLVHVGGVYDHHRAEKSLSEKRCMILTRSGYAGMQRYGANTWSGDITASWQTLQNQIPAALSYTICGNPNWNSDTGGFFNGTLGGPGNDEYNELYARWLQFSTFCPMMRSHGAGTDKAIWIWGKRGMELFDNEERYIGLRYRLLPYIYSTAWDVHQNGHSFMNALVSMFPEDTKTQLNKREFLFGQNILVAPVMKYKATSLSLYLPAGTKWVDFWTGESVDGGQNVTKAVDLQTIPLYMRAGTILPLARKRQYARVADWDTLQIRVYPGQDGEFTLYEDEGDSYRYEQGKRSTIKLTWNDAASQLTIGQRDGSFDGMAQNRVFDVVIVREGVATGDTLSAEVNARILYDGIAQTVTIDPANVVVVEYADERETVTDTTVPYEFHATEWLTGDAGRVQQKNISYDEAANTITINAKGNQNAALQLDRSVSGKYYALHSKPYFCVRAKGATDATSAQQVWFAYGNHVGTVTPERVVTLSDSTVIYAWNMTDHLPQAVTIDLTRNSDFIFCLGLTPTSEGKVVVYDINFYDADYLDNIATGITPATIYNNVESAACGQVYDLSGRRVANPLQPGLYIKNGKKYIIK